MGKEEIIKAFIAELGRAGVTPRDISPLIGLAHTTIYRIMSGRQVTSKSALRSLQFITKFLRQYDTAENLNEAFESWLVNL